MIAILVILTIYGCLHLTIRWYYTRDVRAVKRLLKKAP